MGHAISVRTDGVDERIYTVESELLVGRAKDCGIAIADQRLSRHHARLFVRAGRLFVEDLGGPNGTSVNDESVRGRSELVAGDVIRLGKTQLTVLADAAIPRPVPRREGDVRPPELVKPMREVLAPVLGGASAVEYFQSLGIAEETLHGARADTLEAILRRTRDYAVLHEVSKAIQSELDGEAMLERVLALILEVTRGDRGFAALLDDKHNLELEVVTTKGGAAHGRVVLSQTVAEHVLDRALAVICSDAAADERFRDAASLVLSDTRSLMAVPILVQSRVLGILQVESSHLGRRFDERDLDLLSMIASSVGVALENLRLLERRARTIGELEVAQAQLLATQERLVRTEQLAAIGRLSAGIAHEVRNHLSPFALAGMIAERHPGDAQLVEAAEMMREAEQHILDLVNQVRNFASGAETSLTRAPHDVAELVTSVLKFLRYDAAVRKAKIKLEAGENLIASLDPRSFRQVLINLLRNAAHALPERGGNIDVRVHGERGRIVIEVADEGCGIPPEVAERIFEPFFSTKGEEGLGLGLDISRKIVADHGGELSFESEPGRGTTFRVELPEWQQDETDPVG